MAYEAIAPGLPLSADDRRMAGGITLETLAVSPEQWDAQANIFDGICQEQLAIFSRQRWPGMDVEPRIYRRNGEIVGGAIVMTKDLPLGLGGFAVVKWGPVLRNNAAADGEIIHAAIVDALVAEFADSRRLLLSILQRAVPAERNAGTEILQARGFTPGGGLPFPNRYFVRIGIPDDEQTASFGQKWRYHLRKSRKEALSFEHCPAEEFGKFESLYAAMTDRKQFPDYSAFETLADFVREAPEGVRPELFLVHHEGEPVAGAVIFTAGETAVYLYGATNDRALPLRAGYFLHGEIIRWLGENTAARWYDLGGTDGYEGLHQFKSGMVGKAGAIYPVPPIMHYAAQPLVGMIGKTAYFVRDFRANLMRRINSLRAGR